MAIVQGDHEAVRRFGEASLLGRFAGRETTPGIVGRSVGLMGDSALALGDLDRANDSHRRRLARSRGERAICSAEAYACQCGRMCALAHRGEFDEGERLIEEGVRGARQLGNIRSVAKLDEGARRDRAGPGRLRAEAQAAARREPRTPPDARRAHGGSIHSLSTARARHRGDATTKTAPCAWLAESLALERDVGDRPGLIFNFEVYGGSSQPQKVARARRLPVRVRQRAPRGGGSHAVEAGLARP